MRKKLLTLLLAMTLVLQMCLVGASASGEATVSLSSGTVKPGETVTLTVSIADNPGIAACMLYIYYDTSVFTVDPAEDIEGNGAFRSTGGLIGNSIAVAKENGRYDGEVGKDGVLALWYNGSGVNTSANGQMLTITLTVADGASSGDYAVELGYSAADTCNEEGEDVRFSLTSGTVTVTGGTGSTDDKTDSEDKTDNKTDEPTTGNEDTEELLFYDVTDHWAEDFITAANQRGLIYGYAGYYRPDDTMTRAECVTILWRAAGSPTMDRGASFTDLTQNWYMDAVAWAERSGVVNGVGENKFDPDGTVTREQLAAILHRLAGKPVGMEIMLGGIYDQNYTDSTSVSSWAKSALYWSVYNVIYCGEQSVEVGTTLAPDAAANRAQIAVMMVRYLDQFEGGEQ